MVIELLQWHPDQSNKKSHYAPITPVPIGLVRKSASQDCLLRLRNKGPRFSMTPLELLKQDCHIELTILFPFLYMIIGLTPFVS